MPRTLGGSFTAQKNLTNARPLVSAVFHFGGGIGDIYVSDREVVIGGNAHKGNFAQFGEYRSAQSFRDGAFSVRELPLTLINFPIFGAPKKRFTDLWSQAGIEGVEADVYMNLREVGSTTIYQETLFKAVCRPGVYTPSQCELTLVSVSEKYLDGKELSEPIQQADFPLADLDDVGRRANICYGAVKAIRTHAIVAGVQFALQESMSAVSGYVAIGQDAYDVLPATGLVQIGDEKISYTGKATGPNRLTGLTRGASATPIQSHARDDTVVQVLTEYVYLAALHGVKSISNVRIWRNGLAYYLASYSVELANTTRKPGSTLAIIKVPTPPVIQELRAVEISSSQAIQDNIAVDDSIGVNDTISVVDNIGVIDQTNVADQIGVNDAIGIQQALNESKWEDVGSDSTFTMVALTLGPGQQQGPSFGSYPSISQSRSKSSGSFVIRVSCSIASGTNPSGVGLYVNGVKLFNGNVSVGGMPVQLVRPDFFPISIYRQNDNPFSVSLSAMQITVQSASVSYLTASDVSRTGAVTKTGSAFKTGSTFKQGAASKSGIAAKIGAATKQGTVVLTGAVSLSSTSTAEVVLGDYLTCDVEGYEDDGSGTYTGVANALIAKPADILHHLARVPGGVPVGYIDVTALQQARADAPASHALALCISERTNLKELLIAVGMQSRLRPDWPVDKLTAQFLKTSYPAPSKTITQEEIVEDGGRTTLKGQRSDLKDCVNVVSIYYGREWPAARSRDAFAKVYRKKDDSSIVRFREREEVDRFLFDFIGASNDAMAQDVGDFYLSWYKEPRRIFLMDTKLDQFELLTGDIIALRFFTSFFPASATFAPSAFNIKFDTPGRGIAAARGPELFDGLNGSQKFLVEEFGVRPGNARDKRGTRTSLTVREVP